MQRVHLTIDDIVRTRIVSSIAAIAETIFAMALLERGGGGAPFTQWREQVRRRQRAHLPGSTERHPGEPGDPLRGVVAFLDPCGHQRRLRVDPEVQLFYRFAIAPYWPRVRRYLENEREHRGRILVGGGIEGLFETLHPRVTLRTSVLEVANDRDDEIHLNGRGLAIRPSLFHCGGPTVFTDPDRPDAAPQLVYPTALDRASAASVWSAPVRNDKALGALVGRTRAGVLESLAESRTTSELGKQLGISAAAASQHATVLREAGLITSRRRLNTVVHTLTSLGTALIKGEGPPRPAPTRTDVPLANVAS